jgi:hypothetical protein
MNPISIKEPKTVRRYSSPEEEITVDTHDQAYLLIDTIGDFL